MNALEASNQNLNMGYIFEFIKYHATRGYNECNLCISPVSENQAKELKRLGYIVTYVASDTWSGYKVYWGNSYPKKITKQNSIIDRMCSIFLSSTEELINN